MNLNKIIISLVLAAAILYLLLAQISVYDLEKIWEQSSVLSLSAAFVIYVVINVLRAHRFGFILQKKLSFGKLFNITSVHSFLNGVLPARTGELSYFYFIHKTGKVNGAENVASLLIARIFDILICACFILLSIFFVSDSIGDIREIAVVALAGFFIILFFSVLFLFWSMAFLRIVSRVFVKTKISGFTFGTWILKKAEEVSVSIEQVRRNSTFSRILVSSAIIWFFIFLMIWMIILGLGINISFWRVIFIFTLPIIVGVLPIQTFGGFGTYEGSMALGLAVLGFDKATAISVSFASHVIGILFSLILAVVSYAIMVSHRNQSNKTIA